MSAPTERARLAAILQEQMALQHPDAQRRMKAAETEKVIDAYQKVLAEAERADAQKRDPTEVGRELNAIVDQFDMAAAMAEHPSKQRRRNPPSKRAHQLKQQHQQRRAYDESFKRRMNREEIARQTLTQTFDTEPTDTDTKPLTPEAKARMKVINKMVIQIQRNQEAQFREWANYTPQQTQRRRVERAHGFNQLVLQQSREWQRRAHNLFEDGDIKNKKFPPRTRFLVALTTPSESQWTMHTTWSPREAVRHIHTIDDIDRMIAIATKECDMRTVRLWNEARTMVSAYDPETEAVLRLEVHHDPVHNDKASLRPGYEPEDTIELLRVRATDQDQPKLPGPYRRRLMMCSGTRDCWKYLLITEILPACSVCEKSGKEVRFCSNGCKSDHMKVAHADQPKFLRQKEVQRAKKRKQKEKKRAQAALLLDNRCEPDWAEITPEIQDGKKQFLHKLGSDQFALAKKRQALHTLVDRMRGDLHHHPTFCLNGCNLFDEE